jgi:hypothetical protein
VFTAALSPDAQNALALLGKSDLVSKAYLAGGTALALYFGHRYSVDFGFFLIIFLIQKNWPRLLPEKENLRLTY